MPADIAQQRDVEQLVEPVGVVDHPRIGGAVAELQVFVEDPPDAGHVGADLIVGQELARYELPSAPRTDRLSG